MNPKQYRDAAYRLRAHPPEDYSNEDARDSFLTVYFSMVPFLVLEYLSELQANFYPSGLVFPMGYLLFWGFYYTYYQPNYLEENFSHPSKFELSFLPKLILGVLIWFVKVTLVAIADLILFRWLRNHSRQEPKQACNVYNFSRVTHRPNPNFQAATPVVRPLPQGVLDLLAVLDLGPCQNWDTIHHRYRELAKQFHPDLNREITDVGRRFIRIDHAYRKLFLLRGQYFKGPT